MTLFLTGVSDAARSLRFGFNPPGIDLDFSRMNVSANGYEAPFEWIYPEGRMELLVGLSSLSSRPDATLIVTIDFGQAWSPENDTRILTLACVGLDIEA